MLWVLLLPEDDEELFTTEAVICFASARALLTNIPTYRDNEMEWLSGLMVVLIGWADMMD